MIVTCPACTSRFLIDPMAIGEGRSVRCARCGHTWFERPLEETPPLLPPLPEEFTLPPEETIPIPPGSNLPVPSEPRRSRRAAWWSLGVVIVAGGLGAALYLGREVVVAQVPAVAPVYRALGLMAAQPGAGLKIQNTKSQMQTDEGVPVLFLEGQIVNISHQVRPLGKLRATALGAGRKPLDSWLITPSATRLAPGEIAVFTSSLRNPDPAIKEVSINFTAE